MKHFINPLHSFQIKCFTLRKIFAVVLCLSLTVKMSVSSDKTVANVVARLIYLARLAVASCIISSPSVVFKATLQQLPAAFVTPIRKLTV